MARRALSLFLLVLEEPSPVYVSEVPERGFLEGASAGFNAACFPASVPSAAVSSMVSSQQSAISSWLPATLLDAHVDACLPVASCGAWMFWGKFQISRITTNQSVSFSRPSSSSGDYFEVPIFLFLFFYSVETDRYLASRPVR